MAKSSGVSLVTDRGMQPPCAVLLPAGVRYITTR